MKKLTGKNRTFATASAGVAIAFALIGGGARAQAQSADAEAKNAIAPGEIVVTAQRREQKANDVGIAVSVISASEIKAMNITPPMSCARCRT